MRADFVVAGEEGSDVVVMAVMEGDVIVAKEKDGDVLIMVVMESW